MCTLHLLFGVVAWIQLALVSAYRTYRIEDFCDELKKPSLYLHNEAAIFTFNTTNKKQISCHIQLQLDSASLGFSVFTEQMSLDKTPDCTEDFLDVGRNSFFDFCGTRKRKCGLVRPTGRVLGNGGSIMRINYGDTPEKDREFTKIGYKEMDIMLSIHPPEPREPSKKLKLIVTPFKRSCYRDDHLYKQCPGSSRCVEWKPFCYGERLCPEEWGDEKEGYCVQGLYNNTVDKFIMIPVIFIIVVFSAVVIMFSIRSVQDSPDQLQEIETDIQPPCQSSLSCHPQVVSLPPLQDLPPSYDEVVGVVHEDTLPRYSELFLSR